MPHSKDYFLTSMISYDYEPGKECPEVFRRFIAESFGEDMLPIIRAFTSMFLDPTAPYGRFPHIIGQSGGGKGTLGRFWNSLWGEASDSAVNFSEIATPEGRHQFLTGKRIFGFPDVGGFVQGVRAFYELVDNGELSGRALFNPVGYMKLWNVRFWAASVDFLQIENAGDGYARRAYPIPVLARSVKPDPDLKLKLEAVKAGVISWALAMPRVERDRILLEEPENERVVNLRLDAALYGDSTKSFVDNCLRPTTEPGFMHHHLLHTVYTAYCREHGYTPLGMSKFISHLKTVLPHNFVQRRWGSMSNGKRDRVPAHWEYVTTVPGAFVSINQNEGFRNSGENAPPPTDPIWVCRKSKCEEGGLMEFADFWNPPSPPDDDGGNWGDRDNNPPIPPTPPSSHEGVQGGSKNQAVSNCTVDNPEQRKIKGVQGGSTVQPRDKALEKSTIAVLEKNETEISDTSISSGGQRVDTLDKKASRAIPEPSVKPSPEFKAHIGLKWSVSCGNEPDYSTFPHRASDSLQAKTKLANRIKEQLLAATDKEKLVAVKQEHGANQVNWVHDTLLTESEREKVKATAQTEQLNLLDHSYCKESPQSQSSDPWLEPGNLADMAQNLDSCPDRDVLADLRLCWPPYAMNAACKLLSAEKHAQIKQWVLELNQSAAGD
jgi:hypothetical protein